MLKNAPKLQPQIPDDQWAAQVQGFISEAHEALGLAATIRKKYDESVTHFQAALVATPGNANLLTRIAQSNFDAKKYDEAIKSADAVLTLPNLHPTVKNIAESIKQRATAAKSNK